MVESESQYRPSEYDELSKAWTLPQQPEPLFKEISQFLKKYCGYKLLTFLLVDGQEVARLYSNMPDMYPVSGRKLMGPTEWGSLLINKRLPFLGRDKEAIKWAFFDHELIASLGLGSVMSIPICYDGETIGVISMLDEEFFYTEKHLETAQQATPYLTPAFLQAAYSMR